MGIYCYKLETLKKFVSYKQSNNEIKNKLEQMRALDNGLSIRAAITGFDSWAVDTESDLDKVTRIIAQRENSHA